MRHHSFNIQYLSVVVLTLLFTACQSSGEKQDYAKDLVCKWKLVSYDGHTIETNNRTIFTFNADHTGTQTEAAIDSATLCIDKTWRRQVPLAYSLDGTTLETMWQNTTDARRWITTILSIKNGRLNCDRSTLFKNQSPTVVAQAEYESVTDVAHYAEDIIGTWTGKAGSGGAYGDINHRWVYYANGNYEYQSWNEQEQRWEADPNDTDNEYILDGDFFISRWKEDGNEKREAHDVSIFGNEMIWRGLRANGVRDSFFLERLTPIRSDIEAVLPGKWITLMQDGDSVLTNAKSVHTFDGQGKVYYTVANAGADLTQPWENQTVLTYILMGNDLTEEGYSTTHQPIRYNSQFITVSQDRLEVTSNIGQREGLLVLKRDQSVDHDKKILGFWEGVSMEGPGSFGGAEGIAWQYYNDGTYDYYVKNKTTGKWDKQAGLHYYMVDGSYIACRWQNTEEAPMDYEWWDLSFSEGDSPEYMYWDALRYDSETGQRYHNKFVIKRGNIAD